MSKKFRIAKRISMEDIDHFEDIEVDDDFVNKDMAQIIADNEYDPMYDDCESIAVALQLAGYGKVADLEAKLAESEKNVEFYQERCANLSTSAYGADLMAKDYQWHLEKEIAQLKQQLAEKENTIANLSHKVSKEAQNALDNFKRIKELETEVELARNTSINTNKMDIIHLQAEVIELKQQLAEKEKELKVKEQSRSDWKERANTYCDLIVSLNNILPNKQEKEITFAKVIEDVKNLLAEKDADLERIKEINLYNKDLADTTLKQLIEKEKELVGRKKLCDLRYEQLKNSHQDKIEFAVHQLNKLLDQTALRGVDDWTTWVYCIKSQIKQLQEKNDEGNRV